MDLGDRSEVEVEQIDLMASGIDPLATTAGGIGQVCPEPFGVRVATLDHRTSVRPDRHRDDIADRPSSSSSLIFKNRGMERR